MGLWYIPLIILPRGGSLWEQSCFTDGQAAAADDDDEYNTTITYTLTTIITIVNITTAVFDFWSII